MPSENKTPNIGLNQWQGNENVKRQDFVEDNLIIDEALTQLEIKSGDLNLLTTENKTSLVSAINEVNSKEVDLTSVNERIDENVNQIGILSDELTTHKAEQMPHVFIDNTTEKTYRYGIAMQDGTLGIIYEEVV